MGDSYLPRSDGGLRNWGNNAAAVLSASGSDYGILSGEVSSFVAIAANYDSAYDLANADATRNKLTVAAKDTAAAQLRVAASQVAQRAYGFPGVTDQQLLTLGLRVKNRARCPIEPPALAPLVEVVSVVSRTVRFKISDATAPSKRRLPRNADGAIVLIYSGETPPPLNDPGWQFAGKTTTNVLLVEYPNDVAPGTKCWMTCMWYNARGQSPACAPVFTYLQVGPVVESA
jgi:hypothetical protein